MSGSALKDRVERLGLAFIASCVAAVALYGILRVVQSYLFTEANPATVIWSAHAGYYWRCWTVAYAGVMVGFLAYGASRRWPATVTRGLVHGLTGAVIVILYQGILVP